MLKRVISDERGRALVLALIALGVGALLLPTFLAHIRTNLYASQATEVGIIEYYSSDAAIEYTLWQLKCNSQDFLASLEDGKGSYTIPVGSKVVSVEVEQLSSGGGSNEVDAMLVLDRSGSMDDDNDGNPACTPPYCGNLKDCMDAGGVWEGDCTLQGYDNKDDCIDEGGEWRYGCTLPDYADEGDCEGACCGSSCGEWGPQPITSAKVAAKAFVNILEEYSVGSISHQVGLVSYSSSATLDKGLTAVYTDVRSAIDGMSADGWTGIGSAIDVAAEELQDNGREGTVKAIVLLSDGKANACPDCSSPPCESTCKQYAEEMADATCAATEGGINFFTVALGESADTGLMKYIARFDESKADACEPGNGKDLENPDEIPDFYQYSPDRGDLTEKFKRIALLLAAPHYLIEATVGGTTIQSRVRVVPLDMVGIITWLTR